MNTFQMISTITVSLITMASGYLTTNSSILKNVGITDDRKVKWLTRLLILNIVVAIFFGLFLSMDVQARENAHWLTVTFFCLSLILFFIVLGTIAMSRPSKSAILFGGIPNLTSADGIVHWSDITCYLCLQPKIEESYIEYQAISGNGRAKIVLKMDPDTGPGLTASDERNAPYRVEYFSKDFAPPIDSVSVTFDYVADANVHEATLTLRINQESQKAPLLLSCLP